MDWKTFWKIIEDSYRPDAIDHFEALKEQLGQLKWFEVIEFQALFDQAVMAAHSPALRGAAMLINGSRSEEGFRDFCVWLVGRGQSVYEAALKNPDTLADVLDGEPVDGFGLDAAPVRVYEAKTGMSDFYIRLKNREKDSPSPGSDVPPSLSLDSDDLDDEDPDELQKRYPRLCLLYALPLDEDEDEDSP